MSIAYLDPGNIESDLQSGAVAGFKVSAASDPVTLRGFEPRVLWGWAESSPEKGRGRFLSS